MSPRSVQRSGLAGVWMRIAYVTQWFEPEPNIIKGTSFVRALEAAGHDVTVVTGFPNYPYGRIYPAIACGRSIMKPSTAFGSFACRCIRATTALRFGGR